MAEIVIDNLDDAIVAQLTRRAASAGWSLEREIRGILESAAAEAAEMRGSAKEKSRPVVWPAMINVVIAPNLWWYVTHAFYWKQAGIALHGSIDCVPAFLRESRVLSCFKVRMFCLIFFRLALTRMRHGPRTNGVCDSRAINPWRRDESVANSLRARNVNGSRLTSASQTRHRR